MASPVSIGYLLPDPSRIRTGPPVIQSGGRPVSGWSIPDWHYLTDLSVEWSLEVDLQGLAQDCSLSPLAQIGALIAWRSGRTNLVGCGRLITLADGQNILDALLPGRELGGTVTLEVRMVLLETDFLAGEFAPRRPGSLLWQQDQKIILEGVGGRFPTLATDFSTVGLPAGDAGLWYLEITDSDLGTSASQALRLYLNKAHTCIRDLLDNPAAAVSVATVRFLRYDTVRQLLEVALSHEEFDDRAQYGQGTLGDVLAALLRLYLPGRNLSQLRTEYSLSHADIDAELLAAAWRDTL
jgi:hypothetical protein